MPRPTKKEAPASRAPSNPASPLHAHDLLQRVHDLDEILLRCHDRVDPCTPPASSITPASFRHSTPWVAARWSSSVKGAWPRCALAARAVRARREAVRWPRRARCAARAHASRDDAEPPAARSPRPCVTNTSCRSGAPAARSCGDSSRPRCGSEALADDRLRGLRSRGASSPAVQARELRPADGAHVVAEVPRAPSEPGRGRAGSRCCAPRPA